MQHVSAIALVLLLGTGCLQVSRPGTSTGALTPGAPCASNAVCGSGICGAVGAGNCCSSACAITSAICGAADCDTTGACIYPAAGLNCGPTICSGQSEAQPQCDGSGGCSVQHSLPCAGNLVCNDAGTACDTQCASSADCGAGFLCNAGVCTEAEVVGSCTENDDCVSGVCGVDGTGDCCSSACSQTAPCGATGCDHFTGACQYLDAGNLCGPEDELELCQDGQRVDCAPFDCHTTAGVLSCGTDAGCTLGYGETLIASGCDASPELTQWTSLAFQAAFPPGTDLQLDISVTNSLSQAAIAAATHYVVCDSLQHPASAISCPRNPDGSINLGYFNLPDGSFLTVFATLVTSTCSSGTSQPEVPMVESVTAGESCN